MQISPTDMSAVRTHPPGGSNRETMATSKSWCSTSPLDVLRRWTESDGTRSLLVKLVGACGFLEIVLLCCCSPPGFSPTALTRWQVEVEAKKARVNDSVKVSLIPTPSTWSPANLTDQKLKPSWPNSSAPEFHFLSSMALLSLVLTSSMNRSIECDWSVFLSSRQQFMFPRDCRAPFHTLQSVTVVNADATIYQCITRLIVSSDADTFKRLARSAGAKRLAGVSSVASTLA